MYEHKKLLSPIAVKAEKTAWYLRYELKITHIGNLAYSYHKVAWGIFERLLLADALCFFHVNEDDVDLFSGKEKLDIICELHW